MNESMRKIIYYENILEFKRNTQSQLNLQEVNHWQLCRTCLTETKENDMDLEKMCVMDLTEGRFLTVHEMLVKVTPLQLQTYGGLPLKMCKNCLEKTTTLYFFSIQIKKAEEVLRKMSEQFKTAKGEAEPPTGEDELERTSDNNDQVNDDKCSTGENCASRTIVEEHEISSDGNDHPHDDSDESCISSNEVGATEICPKENEKSCESPGSDESQTVANETVMVTREEHLDDTGDHMDSISATVETETITVPSEEHLEGIDVHMENTSVADECQEEHSDNEFDIAEYMVDEVYLIEEGDEQLQYKSNTSKNMTTTEKEYVVIAHPRKSWKSGTPSRTRNKPQENSKKHRQPRVTKPLLENIKCGVCEKIFNRQFDLVSHVKLNHPNSKAFQCRDCGALFSHTQSLSRHMNTHKPKLNKNTCEYCSKGFLRPDDLRRHIRVHTGERPYSCPLCEKSFKQQSEMKQHMTIHMEEKQYACNECNRAFASRNSLYLHRKAHIAQLTCSQCAKTYRNKQDLLHHEQQIHGKEQYNNNTDDHLEE